MDTNKNGKLEPAEVQAAGLALGKYLLSQDVKQAFADCPRCPGAVKRHSRFSM